MKKHLYFFALLSSIIITSCKNTPPPLTDTQKAEIEKQVLEQWRKMGSAVKKSDAEAFSSFFSTTEFMGMFSGGTAFFSRDEYIDTVRVWFGQRKSNEVQEKTIKVDVLRDNLVLVDQISVFLANFKDDRSVRVNHCASFIFKKEETGWKIIHGHESMKAF